MAGGRAGDARTGEGDRLPARSPSIETLRGVKQLARRRGERGPRRGSTRILRRRPTARGMPGAVRPSTNGSLQRGRPLSQTRGSATADLAPPRRTPRRSLDIKHRIIRQGRQVTRWRRPRGVREGGGGVGARIPAARASAGRDAPQQSVERVGRVGSVGQEGRRGSQGSLEGLDVSVEVALREVRAEAVALE